MKTISKLKNHLWVYLDASMRLIIDIILMILFLIVSPIMIFILVSFGYVLLFLEGAKNVKEIC